MLSKYHIKYFHLRSELSFSSARLAITASLSILLNLSAQNSLFHDNISWILHEQRSCISLREASKHEEIGVEIALLNVQNASYTLGLAVQCRFACWAVTERRCHRKWFFYQVSFLDKPMQSNHHHDLLVLDNRNTWVYSLIDNNPEIKISVCCKVKSEN